MVNVTYVIRSEADSMPACEEYEVTIKVKAQSRTQTDKVMKAILRNRMTVTAVKEEPAQ